MLLSLCVKLEYACCSCTSKWISHINMYERCVPLSMMQRRIMNVPSLLAMHCVDGVVHKMVTWECGCVDTGGYHNVLLRTLYYSWSIPVCHCESSHHNECMCFILRLIEIC
jgi:hypothetical protein